MTVPFYLAASVAVSEDGGPFERWSLAPLLERSAVDPFLTASPFVLVGHGRWRMWYVSATEWRQTESGPRHYYHIRYAESADGSALAARWPRSASTTRRRTSTRSRGRGSCTTPTGIACGSRCAATRYRIALAESHDGVSWTRRDATRADRRGRHEWESEMVEYPCVFDWDGRRYMLYNGNDYGRTGVGLAVLRSLIAPATTGATLSCNRSTTTCGASSGIPTHKGSRMRRALQSSVTLIGPAARPYRWPAGDECSGT